MLMHNKASYEAAKLGGMTAYTCARSAASRWQPFSEEAVAPKGPVSAVQPCPANGLEWSLLLLLVPNCLLAMEPSAHDLGFAVCPTLPSLMSLRVHHLQRLLHLPDTCCVQQQHQQPWLGLQEL